MNGWRECSLGELIDIFDNVRVPLSAAQRVSRKGTYPYYGAQGIIDYIDDYLFDGRYLLVPEDGENLNSRKLPIAYFAEGKFWVNNHAHIIKGKEGVTDDVFLKHALSALDISGYITGAAQPKLTQANLRRISISVPPVETQRRIASILGAYDDLIEVNRRRVKVLEEMARGLFEEWFVRFRFPGHETVPLLDTPNGKLPEGWKYDVLSNVADINASTLKPVKAPAEIGYIDIASVSPGQIDAINRMSFTEAPGRARRIVRDGSILWSNVRPNRRAHAIIMHPSPDVIASTGFTVLDARATSFAYLYHWVTTENFVGYLVGHASGAAYPAVTAATFDRAVILLPSVDLTERFTKVAEPIMRQSDSLRRANERLAASRDLLLPRLISGQLSVAAADQMLAAAE